jgi:transcriptional repressor NrdR
VKCPYCSHMESQGVDSRMTEDCTTVRRRRKCLSCNARFTTYERFEDPAFLVIKKDSRRERFERQKMQSGILKACEKRPISMEQIDLICSQIEKELKNSPEREVPSVTIGKKVMESLKDLDHVAYVRFASVYKEFEDIGGFQKILEGLKEKQGNDGHESVERIEVKSN